MVLKEYAMSIGLIYGADYATMQKVPTMQGYMVASHS
jgi:hypothetical protein